MRVFRWQTMCAAAICAPLLAAAQQQPSDYAREKRWADEIVPSIVSGEAVWLEAPRTEKFLGIYTEAKNARGAIILAHGLGVHPDHGLIGEPRAQLADQAVVGMHAQAVREDNRAPRVLRLGVDAEEFFRPRRLEPYRFARDDRRHD